jgi:hypothetical protein
MKPDIYEMAGFAFCALGMIVVSGLCILYPGAMWEWIKESRRQVSEEYDEAAALTVKYIGIAGLFISLLLRAVVMRGILD